MEEEAMSCQHTVRLKISTLQHKINLLTVSKIQHRQANIRIALLRVTVEKLERSLVK